VIPQILEVRNSNSLLQRVMKRRDPWIFREITVADRSSSGPAAAPTLPPRR